MEILVVKCSWGLSSPPPPLPRPRPPRPQLRWSKLDVSCQTSTAMMWAQCSVPHLNHDHVSSVSRAGPQPRSCELSVPCRTSTARWNVRKNARKNVRRYVRKNVRKNVRRYVRKNPRKNIRENVGRLPAVSTSVCEAWQDHLTVVWTLHVPKHWPCTAVAANWRS